MNPIQIAQQDKLRTTLLHCLQIILWIIFIIFISLWFIHGWLLNIDITLISIELLLVTDVNRKVCGICIFIFNITFFHTIYGINFATLFTNNFMNYFYNFHTLWFIHGCLLNIDWHWIYIIKYTLISIELLLVTDVNRKVCGKCIFIFNITFFHTIYGINLK